MRLSRLRWAVLLQLAKSWRLGLPVPITRAIRVFNLNSRLVYRFLRELVDDGVAEQAGRGLWRLRDNTRARALAEYVLEAIPESPYDYWARVVPETYYYVAEPPSIEWLGYPEETLVIVDNVLRDRISPPKGYKVIYTSMRGREWRYDWDMAAARACREQAIADLLGYDPDYPVEQYIYLNMGRIDLDKVAKKTNREGLKRLATFLAFLRTTGYRVATRELNYLSLADPATLEERLGEYVGLVYANGVAEKLGL